MHVYPNQASLRKQENVRSFNKMVQDSRMFVMFYSFTFELDRRLMDRANLVKHSKEQEQQHHNSMSVPAYCARLKNDNVANNAVGLSAVLFDTFMMCDPGIVDRTCRFLKRKPGFKLLSSVSSVAASCRDAMAKYGNRTRCEEIVQSRLNLKDVEDVKKRSQNLNIWSRFATRISIYTALVDDGLEVHNMIEPETACSPGCRDIILIYKAMEMLNDTGYALHVITHDRMAHPFSKETAQRVCASLECKEVADLIHWIL